MITLPFPHKDLNPNSSTHWSKKVKIKKVARQIAGWETKVSGHKIVWDGDIHLHITFYPPDKRHRDRDNMMASLKSALDGIADGLGVNDSRFRLHHKVGEVVKGGSVMVEVRQYE